MHDAGSILVLACLCVVTISTWHGSRFEHEQAQTHAHTEIKAPQRMDTLMIVHTCGCLHVARVMHTGLLTSLVGTRRNSEAVLQVSTTAAAAATRSAVQRWPF